MHFRSFCSKDQQSSIRAVPQGSYALLQLAEGFHDTFLHKQRV